MEINDWEDGITRDDEWISGYSRFEKKIKFRYDREKNLFQMCFICVIKIGHKEWIISFPSGMPIFLQTYNRMFKAGRVFETANEAKEQTDLFMTKFFKLKAFI